MKISFFPPTVFCVIVFFVIGCNVFKKYQNRPYEYGWVPKNYAEVEKHYNEYAHWYHCLPGETIASIGAGNGKFELTISCFIPDIHWYLQEIDSSRLFQFEAVRSYYEGLKQSPIKGQFKLIIGNDSTTNLPRYFFDRMLMINVFHELDHPTSILKDVGKCLKPDGKLVIMERMGDKAGETHRDCKYPKLYEPTFLGVMKTCGFELLENRVGEKVSMLKIYTFKKSAKL